MRNIKIAKHILHSIIFRYLGRVRTSNLSLPKLARQRKKNSGVN